MKNLAKSLLIALVYACSFSGIFCWEGKVFETQGRKVSVYSGNSSGINQGTVLYVIEEGKVVGEGRVSSILHTKVFLMLTTGEAKKGNIVSTIKPAGNQKNSKFDNRLIEAARTGDLNNFKAALSSGANANAKDAKGVPVLCLAAASHQATREVREEFLKLLLDGGANVNALDNEGHTALMWASGYYFTESMKILIKAGADVNIVGRDGNTALIIAAGGDWPESVRLLLAAKADVTRKNKAGKTALAAAIQRKYDEDEIINMLKSAGASE